MNTTTALTKQQKEVAKKVESYLESKRLALDDKEIKSDPQDSAKDMAHYYVSDRESAGDDAPSVELVKQFQEYRKDLRDISPLVYVSLGSTDEWVTMTINVRRKPRKEKPLIQPSIVKLTIARLEDMFAEEERVSFISQGSSYGRYDGMVSIKTTAHGLYDNYVLDLTWTIQGDTYNGWNLVITWGNHKWTTQAKFKSLTAAMLFTRAKKLIKQLRDPLDGGEWRNHIKTENGSYKMNRRGEDREWIDSWTLQNSPRNGDPATVKLPQGYVMLERVNVVTGERVVVHQDDLWPTQTRAMDLDDSSFFLPKGDKLWDKDAVLAGHTKDGVPIYFGYKDLDWGDHEQLTRWVTPYAGKIVKEYLRAYYISEELEDVKPGSSWSSHTQLWAAKIAQMHSSEIAGLVKSVGGEMPK